MYFLLLMIKDPLFLNILVYYFSFFVIMTMNKESLKISKMLKHTVFSNTLVDGAGTLEAQEVISTQSKRMTYRCCTSPFLRGVAISNRTNCKLT